MKKNGMLFCLLLRCSMNSSLQDNMDASSSWMGMEGC